MSRAPLFVSATFNDTQRLNLLERWLAPTRRCPAGGEVVVSLGGDEYVYLTAGAVTSWLNHKARGRTLRDAFDNALRAELRRPEPRKVAVRDRRGAR